MIPKYFFFTIGIIALIGGVIPAFAEQPIQSTRYKDYRHDVFESGIESQTFGLPEYVWNGAEWVDRIVSGNATHYNVYSAMGSFSFNKSTCTITQYVKGFDPTSQTPSESDIVIKDWFWTIARKNGANPWQVIDATAFSCAITTSQNATGKYLSMKRTDATTGSYLKVDLAAPNDKPVEDFAELFMNNTAWSGNKFAFVLWAKDVKTGSLTFRNGTVISIPQGTTIIDKSQLSVHSMDFVKDGNAFYFDWKKAQDKFKTLLLNKTGNILDVQFGFNDNPTALATGQKMFMDPTYGYSAGTQYGPQGNLAIGLADVSCQHPNYSTNAGGTRLQLRNSASVNECGSQAYQWDISSIPSGARAVNSTLRFDNTLSTSMKNIDVTQVTVDITTASGIDLWQDVTGVTTNVDYATGSGAANTTGNDKTISLGTTAASTFNQYVTNTAIAQGRIAVGLWFTDDVRSATNYATDISNPELQIMYVPSPPDAVTSLTASQIQATTLKLTWGAPNLHGGTLSGYRINSTTPWGDPMTVLTDNTGTSAVTATISGLTTATQYSFRITAITDAGKNASGKIENVTTLAFNQANFTVGDLSFDEENANVTDIFFERDDISATALFLNVTYPDSWELACDFKYKFAMENRTYRNLSFVTIDSDQIESSFRFNNVDREIISVICWDQNGTGGEGRYLITQTIFPLLTYIQKFDSGHYGTAGNFGTIDLVYLAVIIVSMVGLNRTNESVGAGFMIVITAAMAYFNFITIPTAAISGIGLAVMLIIIRTRQD